MEKLKAYLKDHGLTHKAFGDAVGVTQAAVNRYVNGVRFPTRTVIIKIETATNGEVTVADWYQAQS
ncbi:helix-turn-helix domain-containing protein [Ochrobactrum sp. A-1]|uniref:helix-turn-helix domain-containing protein n=1 Tax=Ochrobactrum sp. A-1 TaxID=2920940 RepID=UPI001F0B38F2